MEFATIGSALSSRRKSLNIDQARAAAIIGMSRTTFSSYERDLQRPSAEVLPSLAQFLQISIEDILTLYGGTCIEALRPALERFLATHNVDLKDRPPTRDAGSESPTTPAYDPDDSKDPKTSASGAVITEDSLVTPAPASDVFEQGAPIAFEPDVTDVAVATAAAPRDSSVSIFANELSDDVPRRSELPSGSSDLDQADPKAAKEKSGKKKKGKKGKRSK